MYFPRTNGTTIVPLIRDSSAQQILPPDPCHVIELDVNFMAIRGPLLAKLGKFVRSLSGRISIRLG